MTVLNLRIHLNSKMHGRIHLLKLDITLHHRTWRVHQNSKLQSGWRQPLTDSTPPSTSSQISAHSDQPPAPISHGQQAQSGSSPPPPTRGQSYPVSSSILPPDVEARPPPNPNQRLLVQTVNPNYHVEQ